MSTSDTWATDTVGALRAAFDRSFAQAPVDQSVAVENLLAIRVGADRYAVRMSEIASLSADKKITRLPSPVPELLGIAGFRGTVLPVYDLASLLGYPRPPAPRWLIVTAAAPVALAFEEFDGHAAIREQAIGPGHQPEGQGRHVRHVVQIGDLVRPLISLASVLEWIRQRASDDMKKEQ